MLADKVREALRVSSKVSPDEVKQEFESTRAAGQPRVRPLPRASLRGRGRRRRRRPRSTPTSRRTRPSSRSSTTSAPSSTRTSRSRRKLRHIVIDAPKDLPQDQTEAARTKATNALNKIKGGTAFATVAKDVSTDDRTKGRGGEMGWRKKGFTGFGDAVDKKIFEAKPGDDRRARAHRARLRDHRGRGVPRGRRAARRRRKRDGRRRGAQAEGQGARPRPTRRRSWSASRRAKSSRRS